nr:nitrate- and nitrite sensing domain-containing protein [Streptomyces sp. GC420]
MPTRLNAILLIPVLVGLVMGGFQVKSAIDTWNEAQDAEKIAEIVAAASDYSEALLNERDLSAQPILEGKEDDETVANVRAATDEKAAAFHTAVEGIPSGLRLERRLSLVEKAEPKLEELRKKAYTTSQDPTGTEEGYVQVQHYLMEISNELGLGTDEVASYGRTVYAIQLSKAAESLQRSIGMHLLVKPSTDQQTRGRQLTAFSSYAYLENVALQEYISGGTEEDARNLTAVMKAKQEEGAEKVAEAKRRAEAAGDKFVTPPAMDKMVGAIALGTQPTQLAQMGITPETWLAASTAKFEGYDEIEAKHLEDALATAAQLSSDAQRDAIVNGAIVIIALLAAFVIAGLMARQMSQSMRQLRTAAFNIAEQRLPMLVDQLSRAEPGRVDTRVQPIPITSTDEIGEVARAFDQVHREAVRLASEQALLRGNINAIFTNLSRRNQSLIEGQLTLITDLENNEADPDQLENLFRLDHLATRMRRNGENLLVLAGEEPGRRWDQPVPLVDVLRAASSEVEQYERIELSGVPEAEIHGQAVTDLVHLLAELLENATTFSSPQTKVRVTATRLPDGRIMVEIHDKGIGLTAEDFADINHKLANPPTVDAAISQRMGLFVVGRLADRHGIRVQLRPSGEQAGTTSLVMLPDVITHGGGGTDMPNENDFTVSQIIPETNAFEPSTMRTAAELGFDDSRYSNDVPDDVSTLDPVGRSLMREERRAALEAQASESQTPEEQAFPAELQGAADAFPGEQQASYEQNGYDQGGYDGSGYAQNGYEQNGYEQNAYQAGGYDPNAQGGQDGYGSNGHVPGGYDPNAFEAPGGYQEPAYGDGGFDAPAAAGRQSYESFDAQAQQGEWPSDRDAYGSGYQPEYGARTESASGPDADARERVGFDRPDPAPAGDQPVTDAGLPVRGSRQQQWQPSAQQDTEQAAASARAQAPAPSRQPESRNGAAAQSGTVNGHANGSANGGGGPSRGEDSSGDWRSANDERWHRAEKLRDPKAGGVTPSGLPRRVPKANLIEGAAEQTPQGGPQVSRAPEDVRGRLSNLRRGVQRGRSAGSEQNGSTGFGPGNTYNQER